MLDRADSKRRVLIVDDNGITRDGLERNLQRSAAVTVVGKLNHDEAMQWTADEWAQVDVVLLDAADESRDDDHFIGAQVVRRIRAFRNSSQTLIVVVTAKFFEAGLARRMRDEGADFYYYREEIRDSEKLIEVVLHPSDERRGVPILPGEAEDGWNLGLGPESNLTDFVRYVIDEGLVDALDPDGDTPSGPGPRSRAWFRIRRESGEQGGIRAVTRDGLEPLPRLRVRHGPNLGAQNDPSLPQLRRLFAWAARVSGSSRRTY